LLCNAVAFAGEKCMSSPEAATTSCVGLNPAKGQTRGDSLGRERNIYSFPSNYL